MTDQPFAPFVPSPPVAPNEPRQKRKRRTVEEIMAAAVAKTPAAVLNAPAAPRKRGRKPKTQSPEPAAPGPKLDPAAPGPKVDLRLVFQVVIGMKEADAEMFIDVMTILARGGKPSRTRILGALNKVFA